jgi:hypothetical protein
MTKSNKPDANVVGFGRPPVPSRFKPGQSGNPKGRPRGAKGRKATVKRVLMEAHKADPHGTGQVREYAALELVVLLLKALAAAGDQRAYRALMDLDQRFGAQEGDKVAHFIVVPERLTQEEWDALYSPKDQLMGDDDN